MHRPLSPQVLRPMSPSAHRSSPRDWRWFMSPMPMTGARWAPANGWLPATDGFAAGTALSRAAKGPQKLPGSKRQIVLPRSRLNFLHYGLRSRRPKARKPTLKLNLPRFTSH